MSARVAPTTETTASAVRRGAVDAARTRAGSRGTSRRVELREHALHARRCRPPRGRPARRSRAGPRRSARPRARRRRARPPRPASPARRSASRSVTSSPRDRARRAPASAPAARARPGPCPIGTGRPDLEHLAAPVDRTAPPPPPPAAMPLARGLRAPSSSGAPRQWKVMIGPLSSMRTRSDAQLGRVALARRTPAPPACQRAKSATTRGLRRCPARAARRRARPEYSMPPTPTRRRTSAAARPEMQATQRVAARQPRRAAATSPSGTCASSARCDDRRERAVHVEEQRRARGVGRERAKGLHNAP